MIVPMKHLDLVCLAREKESAVEHLHAIGVVHFDFDSVGGERVNAARTDFENALKAARLVEMARRDLAFSGAASATLSAEEILSLDARRAALKDAQSRLLRQIKTYSPFGDFDVALAQCLLEKVPYIRDYVVLPEKMPSERLSEMESRNRALEGEIAAISQQIASADEKSVLARIGDLSDKVYFESALELAAEEKSLSYISGWVASSYQERLKTAAAEQGWALSLRDPLETESPPTLIEPPKIFKPMVALFRGLGIAPAYSESDVSVPFMCYFSLFFAMLVGDGAYGAIFLAVTWLLRKKLPRSWYVLMLVFSSATIVWGVLSNTWFGAQLPFLASLPAAQWLADPSYRNMMFLCFTIGVSHLMLARLWNAVCRLPDSTSIAEFGWAGILLFMYFVTNFIVGIFPSIPGWAYVLFSISLFCVFAFTLKPKEFKSRGAELGMLPLNIMSALGDIISYVRLFAVGLASVKVAENFNMMATSLISSENSFIANALCSVAMLAILVVGHSLNLAMAGLSVLVHAVRLNTLEFSNHKGVSWSGRIYTPFKRKNLNKGE